MPGPCIYPSALSGGPCSSGAGSQAHRGLSPSCTGPSCARTVSGRRWHPPVHCVGQKLWGVKDGLRSKLQTRRDPRWWADAPWGETVPQRVPNRTEAQVPAVVTAHESPCTGLPPLYGPASWGYVPNALLASPLFLRFCWRKIGGLFFIEKYPSCLMCIQKESFMGIGGVLGGNA